MSSLVCLDGDLKSGAAVTDLMLTMGFKKDKTMLVRNPVRPVAALAIPDKIAEHTTSTFKGE
ncbi:MAG: hypothetical protein CSA25_05215 [Desulfobacter postgatei]|uniref:Uncharacterized protein n=1 Tax=Desulfobacter postgatei TaxID=2293 RepID=A0A2G6MR40_9BACT|nr:MAG: hypothetical protein CSA25_05215 [Desulfobacter postgatei]